MHSYIRVLDDDIDDVEMIEQDAVRPVCLLDRRIRAESQSRHDSGYEWAVVNDIVEHRAIRAIIHSVERDLQFDGLRKRELRDGDGRDESGVIDAAVVSYGTQVCDDLARRVGDRRCDVYSGRVS